MDGSAALRKARTRDSLWLLVHKWTGLVLGIWILLQGLTGAIMAYRLEIQALLDPGMYRTAAPIGQVDYDGIVDLIHRTYPDRRIGHFERDALAPNETIRVITHPADEMPSPYSEWESFVDPGSLQIVATRPTLTPLKALWLLHTGLLAGRSGEVFVGFLGIFLIAGLMAGAVVWWPAKGKWRRALRLRLTSPTPKLLHDLHTVAGAYFVVVLLTVAMTGLVVIFPRPVSAVVDAFFEMRPPKEFTVDTMMPGVKRDVAGAPPSLRLNALAATVDSLYPGSVATLLLLPHSSEKGTFTFRIIPKGTDRTLSTTQVYFNSRDGRMVGRFDPALQPAANTFVGLWSVYIHTGHIAGLIGRALIILTGIVLATMALTGAYIWWKKRPGRRLARYSQSGQKAGLQRS